MPKVSMPSAKPTFSPAAIAMRTMATKISSCAFAV